MSHNASLRVLIACGLLTLTAAVAHADKRMMHGVPHPVLGLADPIVIGPAMPSNAACELGHDLPPVDSFDYLDVTGGSDAYYTQLDPAACTACGTNSQFQVTQVHFTLRYMSPDTNYCTMPVSIQFTRTTTHAGCPKAADERNLIDSFGPFTVPIRGAGLDAAFAQPFTITLPHPVTITQLSYVGIVFTNFGTCDYNTGVADFPPELVYGDTTQCDPCKDFNYFVDSGGQNYQDYCKQVNSPGSPFRLGPPLFWASGECGTFVPIAPVSWGRLKVRYATPRRRRRRRIRRPACCAGSGPDSLRSI